MDTLKRKLIITFHALALDQLVREGTVCVLCGQ
jgi:hypothetical protein